MQHIQLKKISQQELNEMVVENEIFLAAVSDLNTAEEKYGDVVHTVVAPDFSYTDLRGLAFPANANLRGVSFEGANISGLRLYSPDLYKANFKNVTAKGTQFIGGNLDEVSFENAELEKAVFEQVCGKNIKFNNASCKEVDLQYSSIDNSADFTGAIVKGMVPSIEMKMIPNKKMLEFNKRTFDTHIHEAFDDDFGQNIVYDCPVMRDILRDDQYMKVAIESLKKGDIILEEYDLLDPNLDSIINSMNLRIDKGTPNDFVMAQVVKDIEVIPQTDNPYNRNDEKVILITQDLLDVDRYSIATEKELSVFESSDGISKANRPSFEKIIERAEQFMDLELPKQQMIKHNSLKIPDLER